MAKVGDAVTVRLRSGNHIDAVLEDLPVSYRPHRAVVKIIRSQDSFFLVPEDIGLVYDKGGANLSLSREEAVYLLHLVGNQCGDSHGVYTALYDKLGFDGETAGWEEQ